ACPASEVSGGDEWLRNPRKTSSRAPDKRRRRRDGMKRRRLLWWYFCAPAKCCGDESRARLRCGLGTVFRRIAAMSSFGLDSAGASPMTSEKPAASPPLSESQIDALVETVCRALARGQSVVLMSEG